MIQFLLAPVTGGLDPNVAGILNAIVMVVLATYVVLPFMTRLLRGWPYPRISSSLTESVPEHGTGHPHRGHHLSRRARTTPTKEVIMPISVDVVPGPRPEDQRVPVLRRAACEGGASGARR